jgi:filamentous hemagglutinin family protein
MSLSFTVTLPLAVSAAELPAPCVSGSCASAASSFVGSGSATAVSSGNTLTVNQGSQNAVLNWRSFNISADGTVNFVQPNSDSVALNRIYQGSASQIFGALNANGRIYLLNQNGIVFGNGASVNVAGLIASSLDTTPAALDADGSTNIAGAVLKGQPAFGLFANGGPSGDISIASGASISTAEGGQVLIFAPNIQNEGTIKTPGGQTALAAGKSIYLTTSATTTSSDDDYLTGLIIEIGDGGGVVTNGNADANAAVTDPTKLVGQIIAERGNVTLAGLAVNQLGRVSATTSVKQGGSIRLVAGEGSTGSSATGETVTFNLGSGGALRLGQNSVTEVELANSSETSVDINAQPQSVVRLDGRTVVLERNARVVAPSGDVAVEAHVSRAVDSGRFDSASSTDARIYLADGALIDVAGADIAKPMESNVVSVELRGTELADSPLQRDGALRGKTVQVDIRQSGTRDDGSTWYGSPIGDLSGYIKSIPKGVAERSLAGGSVRLESQGDVILDKGSRVDISGGSISYQSGYINTSRVVGADGAVYDIASADPNRPYVGVASGSSFVLQNARWGVTESFASPAAAGHYEAGYVEGKDAGSLTLLGQRVVLDGDIDATTQIDRYQRKLPGIVDATALYRPYDQLPLSGQLVLGQSSGLVTGSNGKSDFLLSDVRFFNGDPAGLDPAFNPWTDALSAAYDTLQLRTSLLGADGIGRLTLFANGAVELPAGTALDLPVAGSLDVRAGTIDVGGTIASHGGSIKLTSTATAATAPLSGGLTVDSGARLDVSGVWVNDMPVANEGMSGSAPLAVRGGSVALSGVENGLTLEAGSTIDASGGAQLTSSGQLKSGAGGSISLATTRDAATGTAAPMVVLGDVRAYGFTVGGSLSLTAGALCVASESSVCQEDAAAGMLRLSPAFFAQGGFSSFTLNSNQGGVEIAPGTELRLRQQNLMADGPLSSVAGGTALSAFTAIGSLADIDRRATNLSINVSPAPRLGSTFTSQSFASAPSLELGSDAAIIGDPTASIHLTSSSRILVDGTISAPAGEISLHLTPDMSLSATPGVPGTDFADQGIWLGSDARLLATGATQLRTDSLGRTTGQVLDGGAIHIDADRGQVLTSAGSLIDVSGTAALLDVRADAQGHFASQSVGSAGGLLEVTAAEAIVLGGDVRGESGAPGTVAGGTLSMTLDPTRRADPGQRGDPNDFNAFFAGERKIELSQNSAPIAFANAELPVGYQGRALLSAEQIAAGGFDAVELAARTFTTRDGQLATDHPGQLALAGDVTLDLARHLTLDAASIKSDGGDAKLAAPYVILGQSDPRTQITGAASSGTGALTVQARQIDIAGNSSLEGFGLATFSSSGDLRLVGVNVSDELKGSLTTAGSLTLDAAQVYPTTLTDFTIDAGHGTDGVLSITRSGDAMEALSAGASLTLRAPTVVQSGTVRAPFGSIVIDSPSITLADGSITSTSGAGLTVPFGETQGGFDWVYELSNSKTLIYGIGGETLPAQDIVLEGDNVNVAAGATLDVRGGGELLASEFVPGTSGTRDVLSSLVSPGSFAVLPRTALASAAFDPSIYRDSQIKPGTSVYLSGYDGLAAGEYIVLPARYALLPGAFLVTPVAGYQDIVPGESYSSPNGSTTIAGYFTTTGTALRDARTSGFSILPGAAIQQQAKYTQTAADAFFSAQAQSAAVAGQRLPRDAGTVSIIANSSLELAGDLRAAAGTDGRGAALDIASDAIRVVSDTDDSAVNGVLSVRASDLNALGVESLLIGGTRTEGAQNVSIDTRSTSVTVASGAALAAPEVMLAASDSLLLAAGASISASGDAGPAKDVSLQGDGAFLRVATSASSNVDRTGSTGTSGSLHIDADASVAADRGSITLESSGEAALEGTLSAADGELNLVGNRISVGEIPGPVPGWALETAQLEALGLSGLILNSRSSVDLYGDLSLGLKSLQLNAASIRGFGDGEASITVDGDITLKGSTGTAALPPSASNGLLNMSADNITFDGGEVDVSGFGAVSMNAQTQLLAAKSSALDVDGALDLSAGRLTTASGVDVGIIASGPATLAPLAGAEALSTVTSLGGSFSLTARSIDLTGRIELPSGIVALRSTASTGGGVLLGDHAIIDVSGRATDFAGESVASGGGRISIAAHSGNIEIESGAQLNVSAAGDAKAGRLELRAASGTLAVDGTLIGGAAQDSDGGSFTADAQSFSDFAALNRALNSGGFAGERSLRQRGAGDLTILAGAENEVRGTSVALTADQGSIVVEGGIRAHGENGGRVLLSAADGIKIDGAIDTRPQDSGERNGRIDLRVGAGGLVVADTATIATSSPVAVAGSAGDGAVGLRLSQAAVATVLNADASDDQIKLAGDWAQTTSVVLEGYRTYDIADGVIDASDVAASAGNSVYAEAASFASQAGAIGAALSNASMPQLEVRPGVEFRSAGSLELAADWDLSQWHFAGQPGVLTLRSAGDLTFNSSLSDGFTGVRGAGAFNLTSTGDSWSYRLIAGADTSSADVLATDSEAAAGTMTIAAGNAANNGGYEMIRTGTGNIDVRAAKDVIFGNQASMIYTAGIATDGTLFPSTRGNGNELNGQRYPAGGGDITIGAGRDVIGAASNQLVTDWLWRVGNADGTSTRSTAWTVNFGSFHQNVGALGGGDVIVTAGRDVDTLSASAPTVGRQTGSKTADGNQLEVIGGGNVIVHADRNIAGGSFYSGRGVVELVAGSSVGESGQSGLNPVIALGDARASIMARQNLALETVFSPTLLPQQGSTQGNTGATRSYFSTYGDASGVALESVAGDVTLFGNRNSEALQSAYGTVAFGDTAKGLQQLLPGTLSMHALRGDVDLEGDVTLIPAAHGYLNIGAYRDVNLGGAVLVSDVDPAQIPSVQRPSNQFFTNGTNDSLYKALTIPFSALDIANADTPVRLAAAEDGTLRPSQIVAATGDVNGNSANLYFGAPVEIHADRDVSNLNAVAQNLVAGSVTSIEAGRDIVYAINRGIGGNILTNSDQIAIDGPGLVTLTAGRDINLQSSAGISTRGNLVNTSLANGGANISALVGLNGHQPDYAAFEKKYVQDATSYAEALKTYIEQVTGVRPTTRESALALYATLSEALKAAFLQQVLIAEVRASAVAAAAADPATHGDYSRGFAAWQTMFPGANPDTSAGEKNPYRGDIALYFSRIYTQGGGDITMLAPGGGVNAGLATPPSSFGVTKTPDKLGIVTQRGGDIAVVADQDLQVNESRVFAIDDSNILVWSSNGDIDAGRGAKTAIAAPSPIVTYDRDGHPSVAYVAPLTGSGIQTRATTSEHKPGDVVLAAPRGVVNAGDAGIIAGNLTIAATAVLGADNIKVSGVSVGVPVDAGGLGASLAGVSSAAGSASNAATDAVNSTGGAKDEKAPIAADTLSWLDVFVTGLGEENCKPDDVECLKRQKAKEH